MAVDLAVLGLFAAQHTVMARPWFKRWWTRRIPAAAERATFVLAASVILALAFWAWRPFGPELWHLSGAAAAVLLTVYAAGWVIALSSTFLISHADLFGLRQAWLSARGTPYTAPPFTERGLYRQVRHPLMTGFVIIFWAAPVMTAGHLLFAAAATGLHWRRHRVRGARPASWPSARPTPPTGPGFRLWSARGCDGDDMGSGLPRVGLFPPFGLVERDPEAARSFLARVADAGLDHVCCADHVSFAGGLGFDGLIQATALALLHPALPVYTGLYLLPLRHPVLVARQLADLGQLAPGRLIFGVGIGGEDRHEVQICGVDPATRGRRMDESLHLLRALLTGSPVTCAGEFFDLDAAVISPAPPAVPVIIGGRSDAAIRRAGRLGDGWLGIWNSPRRFAAAVELAAQEADRAAGPRPPGTACRSGAGSRSPGRRRASAWLRRWRRSTGCRSSASSGTARTARRPTSPSSWPRT